MNLDIFTIFQSSGYLHITPGLVVMWFIGIVLIYLAIARKYEPLLLLPIGFGIILANLPLTDLMHEGEGLIWRFYHYGIQWEIIPPLIFLGLGALTDFKPLLANPVLIFLGAGAQVGVYITFFTAYGLGFSINEAATIGIIGGADGPTTIFLAAKLAPHLLGVCAVAAYSYMAMVPIIQPPIMKLLTTKKERLIKMKKARKVSQLEKLFFPIIATFIIILLIPASAPLISMFMLGNLFRESKVVERLTTASKNELMNIVTIFLGISIGATMSAENFLRKEAIFIFFFGLFAFMISTASGVLLAKLINLFRKQKINPLLGAAGVSAVPMAARVVHKVGEQEDKKNYLLMYAMGPNVAGVIGTVIAAGIFLTFLK
ncbi:MAG: sodium ion-translocating decarboxylase subunit beta [Deltaproteobacteria bacterium]|nr:sodium ion-translocating decarboxylase subunit beta [Deltaproteobacteria bacterium]MBT4263851.1 sodium ion-translocating decarboxylase subunit beta [Deltaproteobacteria bacterium]MBT7155908.1 sodium ion-translocating decarboxylase subunit beta [Deltaproteobacteria bacterium]MBT7713724.1 sodium ion-translocating decarboxylase subunit beta [Deltaproteobacteria bacterium]